MGGERKMVASDSFAEFLREQLAPLGRVTMRRMFGKTGVFCDGVMFGMVTGNMLYLRVGDLNRSEFKEAESSPPLNYEKHLFQERQLRSTTSNTRADAREFLALAGQHKLAVTVHGYPLEEADQALRDLKAGRFDGAAVLTP